MKRIWFNPSTFYSDLSDGTKYYVRLYEYEYVPMLMKWNAGATAFLDGASGRYFLFTSVNRVSEL